MLAKDSNSDIITAKLTEGFPLELSDEDVVNVVLKFNDSNDCDKKNVVTSFSIKPVNKSCLGLSGSYFNLLVDYQIGEENEKSKKFFIKSLDLFYPVERNRVKALRLFDREKLFYDIIEDMKNYNALFKWQPQRYLSNDSLLILDDIESYGYKTLNQNQLTPDLIKQCIGSIAYMHAMGIAFLDEYENQDLPRNSMLSAVLIETDNPWVQTGVSAIKSIALQNAKNQSFERKKFINDELVLRINALLDLLKFETNHLKTFCHCDLRPKNIHMKINEDSDDENKAQFIFLDYQQVRFLPPAIDILLFLYYNIRKPLPTEGLIAEYTNYYYDKLKSSCKIFNVSLDTHLPYEQFQITLNEYRPIAIIMRALYAPFLYDTEYAVGLKKENPDAYLQCMSENRMPMLTKLSENDSTFEEFIYECSQDVLNTFDVVQ